MKREDQRICKPLVFKFLFALMLIFSFSIMSFGQTLESDESSVVNVPEQFMKQVVRRILVWSFKPRSQPKVIFLSKAGIKKSWLPKIKNIEFRLLSDGEYKQRNEWIYFFTETEVSEGKYQIGFGLGDYQCNSTGDSWYFRITKQKVRIWQNGSFGSGCGGSPNGLG
ncbi:MAG: hypothetical protein ABJA66_00445 [Actinomycetota bacterium]